MDNRWKFLYLIWKEMWGRRKKAGAGNGKTGTSGVGAAEANPCSKNRSRDVDRTRVGKPAGWLPRKAAINPYKPVP